MLIIWTAPDLTELERNQLRQILEIEWTDAKAAPFANKPEERPRKKSSGERTLTMF